LTIALSAVSPSSHAQSPAGADQFDPPDTEYATGLTEIDPATLATLPVVPQYRAFIPVSVDLSYRMPAVGSQGKAGSCVGWAVAYAARGYYTSALDNRDTQLPQNLASPNYVYNVARQIQKKSACSGGTNLHVAVEVLKKGALSLADYPYHAADCDTAPAPDVIATARDFRVRGLRIIRVAKIDDVKGTLARSHPVLIAFNADRPFQRHRGDGVFNTAEVDAKTAGWHEMALVGYDERKQAFRLINSWGPRWGDHGYAWISYEVFTKRVREAAMLDVGASAPKVAEVKPPQPRPDPPQPKPRADVTPPPPKPKVVEDVPPPPPPPPPTPAPPQVTPELAELATLSCAKVAVRKQAGGNVLTGFVASDADLDRVKRIAAEASNTSLGDVMVAPWPQCEALQTLEKALATSDQARIDIGTNGPLNDGDTLRIAIEPPSQISFLYVSYVQADGSVVHLVQPEGVVPQPALPGKALVFGDGQEGRAKFTVSGPFGREMIIAVASRSPLFEQKLPARQTEREYLTALRRVLAYKPDPSMADREVSATVRSLETRPR